jgi:AmiR/NasT family two-component response regulator
METRSVIEQAKGILMAQQHCSSTQAFDVLTKQSQRTNRKLRDIASDIVANAEQGSAAERPDASTS